MKAPAISKQLQHLSQRKIYVRVTRYTLDLEWSKILNRTTERVFYFGGHDIQFPRQYNFIYLGLIEDSWKQ